MRNLVFDEEKEISLQIIHGVNSKRYFLLLLFTPWECKIGKRNRSLSSPEASGHENKRVTGELEDMVTEIEDFFIN